MQVSLYKAGLSPASVVNFLWLEKSSDPGKNYYFHVGFGARSIKIIGDDSN